MRLIELQTDGVPIIYYIIKQQLAKDNIVKLDFTTTTTTGQVDETFSGRLNIINAHMENGTITFSFTADKSFSGKEYLSPRNSVGVVEFAEAENLTLQKGKMKDEVPTWIVTTTGLKEGKTFGVLQ